MREYIVYHLIGTSNVGVRVWFCPDPIVAVRAWDLHYGKNRRRFSLVSGESEIEKAEFAVMELGDWDGLNRKPHRMWYYSDATNAGAGE